MTELHTAGHRHGVVCAPHAAAVEDGRAILEEGGNAIEAMLAMAASIAAVYPHMNHIGGDGFWLIREPNGRVRAIMGAGRGRREGDAAFLSRCRASRNPGARAAGRAHRAGRCRRLDAGAGSGQGANGQRHQQGASRLPLHVLFDAAIRRAREGYKVTRSQAQLTRDKFAELENVPGFAEDVSDRRQGAGSGRDAASRPRLPRRSSISPMRASTISIAAMSAARSPPTWSASARR